MRLLIASLVYATTLLAVGSLALLFAFFFALPHGHFSSETLAPLVLLICLASILVLPVLAARTAWRRWAPRSTR